MRKLLRKYKSTGFFTHPLDIKSLNLYRVSKKYAPIILYQNRWEDMRLFSTHSGYINIRLFILYQNMIVFNL